MIAKTRQKISFINFPKFTRNSKNKQIRFKPLSSGSNKESKLAEADFSRLKSVKNKKIRILKTKFSTKHDFISRF